MLQHGLFAPATFPDLHTGNEHHTFVAPDGEHEKRIDYIALPQEIKYDKVVQDRT